jgi:hypothetical protein
MNIIIDWQPWSTKFSTAEVTMDLRPLKTSAMLLLMPHMNINMDDAVALVATSMEVQALAPQILPEHVRKIDGITVNGQPITPEHLAEESIFTQLTAEIMGQLMAISTVSRDAEKNSGRPSDSQQPGNLPDSE